MDNNQNSTKRNILPTIQKKGQSNLTVVDMYYPKLLPPLFSSLSSLFSALWLHDFHLLALLWYIDHVYSFFFFFFFWEIIMFIEFYCRDTYVQSLPIDLMRHFFFLIIWPWEIHNFAKFKHVAPFEFFNVVVGCFMIKLPR